MNDVWVMPWGERLRPLPAPLEDSGVCTNQVLQLSATLHGFLLIPDLQELCCAALACCCPLEVLWPRRSPPAQ